MDGIVTPEAVVLDVETAGVASRVFAGLLDLLISLGIVLVALVMLGLLALPDSSKRLFGALLIALVMMGYPLLSETLMRGRTVGKRAKVGESAEGVGWVGD